MEFVLGQRWVSQTESELGLGIVIDIEGRHVTVQFPAAEEERVYALNNCPLARVIYQVGETLHDLDQRALVVDEVNDLEGLKCYLVKDAAGTVSILPETQISGLVHLSSPSQRLLSGQFDKALEYRLRVASLYARDALQKSNVVGMLGTRTQLIPHQVYIAHEVASRFAPRVLLADEVGLGKTIEAGMILHRQLQTGLASRVLIVVPDALLHQWLVEMLRKFGLHFALFDQERYDALIEAGEGNPFESEQLVLCSLDLLANAHLATAMACDAGWDLLVVDEAHHLGWQPDQPSSEYALIEQLAQVCAGLLLLTATPEQLGVESHFARLRLLDPARFADLDQFLLEQGRYGELNDVVRCLTNNEPLNSSQEELLNGFADNLATHSAASPSLPTGDNNALIEQLLDQHGTGRVLFRNTRAAISGFPIRQVHGYALSPDADDAVSAHFVGAQPELHLRETGQDWLSQDPRVRWLESFLVENRQRKVLLICASAETAIDLEKHLHLNVGVRSAAFYEGLSIIERDRAAAYFADEEAGAQTLICSEIGSEGRNFQFSHHLVLFDLPTNPDLLEQRIGRLDRIGQTQDVQIHVPHIAGTAQEMLFRWYHEGLNAFCNSLAAGGAVMAEFETPFNASLAATNPVDPTVLQPLLERAAEFTEKLRADLQQGRDSLLELNSCKPAVAASVIDDILALEAQPELAEYIDLACDAFGIEPEPQTEQSIVLKPTEHTVTHAFPEVGDDGLTVTFDRATAIAREDIEFLTWESPVVTGLLELILGSELGNTNISTMSLKALPAGTLLVECYFAMHCSAPKKYQLSRFLPATPIRVLLDTNGRDLSAAVKHEALNARCERIRKSTRPAIIKEIRTPLSTMLDKAQAVANTQDAALKQAATERVEAIVGQEIERLGQLQKINPAVRDDEIDFFVTQAREVNNYIKLASLEPQAARVIITT